ncbi:MAG: Holliday junction resolvase RuvX [Mycoplasma sp.]
MRKIGLDLGSKTCGISISDHRNQIATGLCNFEYEKNNMMMVIHKLKKIVKDYEGEIDKFILGYPVNYKTDTKNLSCIRSEEFKLLLEANFDIEVVLFDENHTTTRASTFLFEDGIKASQRKKVIDMVSAIIILQDFLNSVNEKNKQ